MKPCLKAQNELIRFQLDDEGDTTYLTVARYYNYDNAVGINNTLDVQGTEGDMVTTAGMSDGSDFEPTATYTCAINSCRGSGGSGHLAAAGLSIVNINDRATLPTGKDLRYDLKEWIKEQDTVVPEKDDNWSVIPEAWAVKGKEKAINYFMAQVVQDIN